MAPDTFTQIIFPPKEKKVIIVPPKSPPPISLGLSILDYWFREVHDHVDNTHTVSVMVKCPMCGEVYEFMKIPPDRVDHIRRCMQEHENYYYNYSRVKCPKCHGRAG